MENGDESQTEEVQDVEIKQAHIVYKNNLFDNGEENIDPNNILDS